MNINSGLVTAVVGVGLVSLALTACAGDMEKREAMEGDKSMDTMMEKKTTDSQSMDEKMMEHKGMEKGEMGQEMKKEM